MSVFLFFIFFVFVAKWEWWCRGWFVYPLAYPQDPLRWDPERSKEVIEEWPGPDLPMFRGEL
jgi:hypothetical protein